MKLLKHSVVAAISLTLIGMPALAFAESERGSEAEAEAMVKRAVALVAAKGPDLAYRTFTQSPPPAFRERDLFVFVLDANGVSLANGRQPKMVGKSLIDMKDVDGTPLIRGILEMVKTNKGGWYGPYKAANPATGGYERKKTYCEQGAGNTAVCVGVFLGK